MARIYGHDWPVRWGKEGQSRLVKIYSNGEQAELFLNGQSLGVHQRDSQDFPAAGLRWLVPFKPGRNTLRVVASRQGREVTDEIALDYQIETWGEPA